MISRLFLALSFSPEYSHVANSLLELPFYSVETTGQSPSKIKLPGDFPGGSDGEESACSERDPWVRSLSWEDPLEEGMATHSRILAWRIPWTEEPGGPQSMGSQSQTWLSD